MKVLQDNSLPVNDENIFIIASCEQKGLDFLLGKATVNIRKITDKAPTTAKKTEPQPPAAQALPARTTGPRSYTITVNDRPYAVTVNEAGGIQAAPVAAAPATATEPAGFEIEAPTPGMIVKIMVSIGSRIIRDQPLLILEAMKMESEVKSPCEGTVQAIHVAVGETVQSGEPLLVIG